jgi:hypothetical protein
MLVALLSNWPDELSNHECLQHAADALADTLASMGDRLNALRPYVERTPGGSAIRYEPTTSVRIQPTDFIPVNMTLNVTMSKTKVHAENLVEAFKAESVKPPPPKKSVWEWLRDPGV